MDIRQLEMFHAVAEKSSFTAAGEVLHVAQSAVSRKIKLLEEELGEKLFKRANKRVFLTPAGELMLRHTRRIFKDLRNAALDMSDFTRMNRGTLRIGTGMTACMYVLPPILEKFQKQYPNIDIAVVTGTTGDLVPQLENSLLDLAVMTLPVSSPNLEVIPFTREEMVLVTSPRHRVFGKRNWVQITELADYPMILFPRGTATRSLIDRYFQTAGITPKIAMEAETVATIKPLVRINLGIALVPLLAVKAEAKRGELHYLRIRGVSMVREIGLVYQRSDFEPKPLLALLKLFGSGG